MQSKRYYISCVLVLLVLTLLPSCLAEEAAASEPALGEMVQANDYGSVSYPQLSGLSDIVTQVTVNQTILDKGELLEHMNTLNALQPGGFGLRVTYEAMLNSDILTVCLNADGLMPNGRQGQRYSALAYDLTMGTPITAERLFTDVTTAQTFMEGLIEESVAPQLSGYLENGELTPLPMDNFYFDREKITFYYDAAQFSMLSGYCGGASFFYYELADYLDLSDNSVLARLGVKEGMSPSEGAMERIAAYVAKGTLPGIDAAIGDTLDDLAAAHRVLRDPDIYPGGRFFQLEDPGFRDIQIMTDGTAKSYKGAVALGIRADRVNLCGLLPGVSTGEDCQRVLGTPTASVTLDEETAESYYLPVGVSNFYAFGDYQLRLHMDGENILRSVQVLQ